MFLLALNPYLDILLAAGLAFLSLKLIQALFGPLSGLPLGIGTAIAKLEHAITQSLASVMGTVWHPIDPLVASSIHAAARLIDTAGGLLKRLSIPMLIVAPLIGNLYSAYHLVRSLAHSLAKEWHGIEAGVKSLTKAWHGIEHRVRALERAIGRGIGHDLRVEIAGLKHEIYAVEKPAIKALTTAERDAQSAIDNLYEWAKGKAALLGIGTFAMAVTAALAAIGNGWLACKENPFSSSKDPCGLWANLARFLPFLGLLAIGFDFPEFVKAAELVAEGIGEAVAGIERAIPIALPELPPPN